MAGWDGDALAEKLEQAQERQQEAVEERRTRAELSSPEERERKGRAESARLNRARLAEQLARATSPAHRAMLERALKALDKDAAAGSAPAPETPPGD